MERKSTRKGFKESADLCQHVKVRRPGQAVQGGAGKASLDIISRLGSM